MDSWASAIITTAALACLFFAVMGFRGLIQTLDKSSTRCARCGRIALFPLPQGSHECHRCHYGELSLGGRLRMRH